jgi:hypothetical protein
MKAKMTSTSDDAGVVLTHWNCKTAPGWRPTPIMAVTAAPRLLRRDSQIPAEVKYFTDS